MPVEQEVPVQVGTPVHSYAVEPERYQEYPAAEPMQSWSSPDAEINFSEEDLLKNAMNTRDLDEPEPVHVMEASQAESSQTETTPGRNLSGRNLSDTGRSDSRGRI